MKPGHTALASIASFAAVFVAAVPAVAVGGGGTNNETHGGKSGKNIYASATYTSIKVRQVSGPTGGKRGSLASVDVNWKPPACWYEPVFTGQELKDFVNRNDGDGDVGIHESWFGKKLWTDHYRDGKPEHNFDDAYTVATGYKNWNIGKDGYFWRSVAPDESDPESWDCGKIMFWQDANVVPKVAHAPTPKMLAEAIAEGLAGLVAETQVAYELALALLESPFHADEEVVALLRRARVRVPLVLVSNAALELESDLDSMGLGDLADHVVNSARVGLAKPDPRIYRLAAELAGTAPERCLFVDDGEENVEAASALGMRAVHFREPADLERALEPLFA
jgi:HAD superfamily hydrolase (TIGR01509 family)